MPATVAAILDQLRIVDSERERRATVPELQAKVLLLKEFQRRRFARTYDDLLLTPRYGAAARFFLDELYGPNDFTRRDAQFARVVPALVHLFPAEVVETVATLAELHALSEVLDSEMAGETSGEPITAIDYVGAWQRTGHCIERSRQIALTDSVATRLDGFTRKPLMRSSLLLMRGPARAAGLSELQRFLERGFDAFRAMKGAHEFIAIFDARERALASSLFSTKLEEVAHDRVVAGSLGNLPAG